MGQTKHFACTACGACCHGWLPLTLDDAVNNADRFPLVMNWSTVREGGKSFARTTEIGYTFTFKKKKTVAVRITPMAYIPPGCPCPALGDDGLCAIHENKPLRCRAMPFSAYRAETDQADLLVPQDGWACETDADAPVVYEDGAILVRDDYEAEKVALDGQAKKIQRYAQRLLDTSTQLQKDLAKGALKPTGGHVIVNFTTILPYLKDCDPFQLAADQVAVLDRFIDLTEDNPAMADYHDRYQICREEFLRIRSTK